MFIATAEEKVPLEAKKEPFMVCGFLGLFWNFCYGTEDHLGSTRMVLNEDGEVKEALMYQPYGTVSDVQGIPATRLDPLRNKFTSKEFDEDGENSENGAPGIQAYHFGARVYDPDIGVWQSTDPAAQYYNSYSYVGGNPVIIIDPNGEYGYMAGLIGGAAIGGSIGFVVGGLSGDGWDWKRAWAGYGIGTAAGAAIGFGTSEHFLNYARGNGFLSNYDAQRIAYINNVRANAVAPDYISQMDGSKAGLGTREAGMARINSYGANRSYYGNLPVTETVFLGDPTISSYVFPADFTTPVLSTFRGTSSFNPERLHPKLGIVRPHNGTDVAAGRGLWIQSSSRGTATVRNNPDGYGNYIDVNHGNGLMTRYAHLDKVFVSTGDVVKPGVPIGTVGSTGGISTGPHLHYEIRLWGTPIDPKIIFPWW